MEHVKKSLASKGIDPGRLQVAWISAAEGKRFASVISEMVEKLKQLLSQDSLR
jgi:coenzyme F420-reducing hydrogenase delta subunit